MSFFGHYDVEIEDFRKMWKDFPFAGSQFFAERCKLFNNLVQGNFCGNFH